MSKRIRIKDLAERAGVSKGTVDRVIHNRGNVSTEAKESVLAAMKEFAGLAQSAKDLLGEGKGSQIGPLLSENFALRTRTIDVSDGNKRLVKIAEQQGAHAKLAGSGGAVIGVYDGDPQRFDALMEAYAAIGAKTIRPVIKSKGES